MMDVKLTVTKTLDDNIWGFSDILEGFDDVSPDERRTMIIEYIRDVDPWEAVDPDAGAIWTVAIDGDAFDWQARAEAAERRVAELEAANEWRPVTGDDLPEDHDEALVTVENEDGYRFVDMAEFTVGGVWWQRVDTGWQELKRVTHWRPLPPPPAATE